MTETNSEADRIHRLLTIARAAQWTYPTSSGQPTSEEERRREWFSELKRDRGSLAETAHQLLTTGQVTAAHELAALTWRIFMVDQGWSEGRDFLRVVLASEGGDDGRWTALALYGDSLFAFWLDEIDESRRQGERALEVADRLSDAECLVLAHLGICRAALASGQFENARHQAAMARDAGRGLPASYGQAPLHLQAQAVRQAGNLAGAAALFAESIELNRRIGDNGMLAVELQNRMMVEIHRGNPDSAEDHLAELVRLAPPVDDYSRAMDALSRAALAVIRDRPGEASEQLRRAEDIRQQADLVLAPDDGAEFDWVKGRITGSS